MSGEMIAIVAVGVALAGLILTGNRGLRQDMGRLESRLDERIGRLEAQFGELRERMAHPPGRLAGRIARGHHRTGCGWLKDESSGAAFRPEPTMTPAAAAVDRFDGHAIRGERLRPQV